MRGSGFCALTLLSIAAATSVQPHEATRRYHVRGRILSDFRTSDRLDHPVPSAWIAVAALRQGTYSDSVGRFSFKVSARPGCYRLRAIFIGHSSLMHDFPLGSRGTVDLGDIYLEPSGIQEDYPTHSGTCVPADSNVGEWAEAFGEVEADVVIPDGVALDS